MAGCGLRVVEPHQGTFLAVAGGGEGMRLAGTKQYQSDRAPLFSGKYHNLCWVFVSFSKNNKVKGMRSRLASLFLLALRCAGQCPNRCSLHGVCNNVGVCECTSEFEGADCSERRCPVGLAFSDVASDVDTAHQNAVCSGRGGCVAGSCICDEGFTGVACERSKLCCLY